MRQSQNRGHLRARAGSRWALALAGLLLGGWACAKVAPAGRGGDGGADASPPLSDSLPPTTGKFACGAAGMGNSGCSFFAAEPPVHRGQYGCYALVVVNPGTRPAKLSLKRGTRTFDMPLVSRLPRGSGEKLTYSAYDEAAGLAPGDVAIVFLAGGPLGWEAKNSCPPGVKTAFSSTTNLFAESQVYQAFELTSDQPVIAYDIAPFGGALSHVSAASLLIPVEAWSRHYVASVPRQPAPLGPVPPNFFEGFNETFVLIVASQDGTEVTLRAPVPIRAGNFVPGAAARENVTLRLNTGEFAQVMEHRPLGEIAPGLAGTVISSNKPVGVVGAITCMTIPAEMEACDGAHQQVPPLSRWGHEYVAVQHRSRLGAKEEPAAWQITAAVDGTVLTYLPAPPTPYSIAGGPPPVPAPTTLAAGQTVQFWTSDTFVVRSQGAAHPIHLAGMMSGAQFLEAERPPDQVGAGDPEWVNVTPTDQFMTDTTFFTDPTYSETSLVVVRTPDAAGRFADVRLGCAGAPISGWMPVGPLQFARINLVSGRYQPVIAGCDNGIHRLTSNNPFSVTVWGWSTRAIEGGGSVSYAYPGGSALRQVNDVIVF